MSLCLTCLIEEELGLCPADDFRKCLPDLELTPRVPFGRILRTFNGVGKQKWCSPVIKFSMLTSCSVSALRRLQDMYSRHPSSQSSTSENNLLIISVNDSRSLYFQKTSGHPCKLGRPLAALGSVANETVLRVCAPAAYRILLLYTFTLARLGPSRQLGPRCPGFEDIDAMAAGTPDDVVVGCENEISNLDSRLLIIAL